MDTVRTPRAPTARRQVWIGVGCLLAAAGCGSASRETNEPSAELSTPAGVTERSDRGHRLPSPDLAEISYDPEAHLLRLYDLPAPARWMVLLPTEKTAVPVDREYKLPEGTDSEKTFVYYAQPGGRQSKLVSLHQIQLAHDSLTSRNP